MHGGGAHGDGSAMLVQYGTFGNASQIGGIKFVFPSSFREGGIWYETFKNGCGNSEACGYNEEEVVEMGGYIEKVIMHEQELKGWDDGSHIYLAGFS